MRSSYRHPLHSANRDAAAALCRQAPKMVVSGVCPHCGKHARRDAYGLTCLTCGWSQDAEPPVRE